MSWSKGLACLFLITPAFAGNIYPANRYAYAANSGWIDFSPTPSSGVTVGSYYLKGYAYSANYGWISFGNTPANKVAYSLTGSDFGVSVNPATGILSGYAYAANTGWIRFNWAAANDPNAARVNHTTGAFVGYAFSPNVGWIGLSNLKSTGFAITDADGDGMDDAWEISIFGNTTTAGIGTDFDKDGQTDAAEYTANTAPNNSASWLRITSYAVNGSQTASTITFTSSPSRLYQIQTSTNLSAWSTAATNLAGTAEFPGSAGITTTVTCTHPNGPLRFYRVVARKF
jgi:hypothetical protein